MKLTNNQKGHILSIPIYLIVSIIIILLLRQLIISIIYTPILVLFMWIIIITITVMTIRGISYLNTKEE